MRWSRERSEGTCWVWVRPCALSPLTLLAKPSSHFSANALAGPRTLGPVTLGQLRPTCGGQAPISTKPSIFFCFTSKKFILFCVDPHIALYLPVSIYGNSMAPGSLKASRRSSTPRTPTLSPSAVVARLIVHHQGTLSRSKWQ